MFTNSGKRSSTAYDDLALSLGSEPWTRGRPKPVQSMANATPSHASPPSAAEALYRAWRALIGFIIVLLLSNLLPLGAAHAAPGGEFGAADPGNDQLVASSAFDLPTDESRERLELRSPRQGMGEQKRKDVQHVAHVRPAPSGDS